MNVAGDELNAASVVMDNEPDADLSNADFGNAVDPAATSTDTADASVAAAAAAAAEKEKPATDNATRDEKGRFVKQTTAGAEDVSAAAATAAEAEAAAAATTAAAAADPAADPKDKNVPYSRFKEVVDQRNALATKLSEAEAERAKVLKEGKDEIQELADKRDALYEKVETLRADGDAKGAAAAQRQIDEYNLRIADTKADLRARQAAFMATENSTYDTMLEHLESAQPVMDPNAPEYDAATVREMEFQVAAYEKMGLTPTQALRRAATLIFREDPFTAKRTEPAAKKEDSPPKEDKPAVKQTDIKKNVEAAAKTPAAVEHKSDAGDQAGTKSVHDMSEAEFAALPASTLARLRGDTL